MTDRSRRRPWLAAVLALVVSGLGHAYLRRWGRALGWYVAVTATLVVIVPDAAVEGLIAGDAPPVADVAPALLVVAASVIDAYVLALRNNRDHERERRSAAAERARPEASSGRTEAAAPPDSSGQPTADRDGEPDAMSCPHCGRETDPSFDFCQWCAEPVPE
ncbi:zinc ribbon domain-containing protein [Halorubrum sp. Ib24]|uniref:zinc ribbon domain-containing protein n=1 Tax=Halorubrum sp. Ib24 TaxID=1383850 RepID=UPI000B990447|nr:zinc ribbon domain-containing protein [Halorubrum sp. Ib24]OYR39695.1 zinc ribbon domain-containing protein [Halorubrum sp. Ib24]